MSNTRARDASQPYKRQTLSVSLQSCVWVCVCACLCVHACACVCAHVCLCARTHMSACVQVYTFHTWVITAQNFPAIISRYKDHLMFRCVQEKVCCLPLFHNRSPKNLTDNSSTTKALYWRGGSLCSVFPQRTQLVLNRKSRPPSSRPHPLPHSFSASVSPVGSHCAHSFLLKKYETTPLDSDWKSEATRQKNYSLHWGLPEMRAESSQILCEEAQGWSGFKVSFVTSALWWS